MSLDWQKTGAWILLGLIAVVLQSPSSQALHVAKKQVRPAAGVFLVAKRSVTGSVFRESIVLLFEAGPGGSAGLIVNRPTELLLREAFDEFPSGRKDRVFLGGPVEPRGMLLLFHGDDPPKDSREIRGGLHLGQSADSLRGLIERGAPAERMRSFLGYAGWAPGQLEFEIERGDWYLVEHEPALALRAEGTASWEELIHSLEAIRVRGPGELRRFTRTRRADSRTL